MQFRREVSSDRSGEPEAYALRMVNRIASFGPRRRGGILLLVVLLLAGVACAADFKAGLAAAPITPKGPVRMSGYAGRTQPSQGVVHDLWAKALAIEDGNGKFVLITLDLISVPANFAADITGRIFKDYGIPRERVLLNCSHTHAGPVLTSNAYALPEVEGKDVRPVENYTEWVKGEIVRAAGAALKDLAPARLTLSHAKAGFAGNRREVTPTGIKIGSNPNGPVDHDVPVIAVRTPDGKLRGVVFAYACHNTTLTAKNFLISGDYAGFAQIEFEKRHPGVVAMFMQLCGGDQNPTPRTALEIAERHGKELADAADRALAAPSRRLRPPLRAALEITELTFPNYPRSLYESRLNDKNQYRARHARRMLDQIDTGRQVRGIPYPVHAVRFGKDATIIALGGEVVIDYALRAKREFGREDTIVAGYSNDVMCYIPSLRVLKEGGYEADDSLLFDGLPGPFDESVEERVFRAMRAALKKVGR